MKIGGSTDHHYTLVEEPGQGVKTCSEPFGDLLVAPPETVQDTACMTCEYNVVGVKMAPTRLAGFAGQHFHPAKTANDECSLSKDRRPTNTDEHSIDDDERTDVLDGSLPCGPTD